ncbi:MAG: 30S ribosome-binding factor RbfA [Candidatus Obscuribacterales bacterium]|nr:30S ribosome-binding factor RbfA [Candidatus Obscuribacterales bacterium]
MSTPRHLRVAQSIKRELSDIILRGLKDARIGGIVSVTDVECTNDCRHARIFISVFGDENQQKGTMEALEKHQGEIRGQLGRRLQLRFAPEITFKLDDSLERGAKVTALINQISKGEI